MLDKEFKYYLDHQSELLPLYDGKYVMIVGDKVVGAFNSIGEAYYNGKDRFGLGNLLVQLCTPGDSAYTVNMLIGMDIISMCDFSLTSTNDQTKFSFQIPSSLDIDFTLI